MFKSLLLALSASLLLPAASFGQVASAGATGDVGRTSGFSTQAGNQVHLDTPGANGGHMQLVPEGWADVTNTQGVGAPNGPNLVGSSSYQGMGDSGTVTSAPFAGSYYAPGNLQLRNEGGTHLPETRLDSFVYQSGYNDHIYGDESTHGPPPYFDFEYIEDGINSPGLTTGHPSDAPSAWGTPQ